jgi:hypothetical protein
MSVEQPESAIQTPRPEDLRRLVPWFGDHRHELLRPLAGTSEEMMGSEQEPEGVARLAEADGNPEALEPFEKEDLDQLARDLIRARAQNAPPRQG